MKNKKIIIALIGLLAMWAILDVIREYQNGEFLSHLYFELAIAFVSPCLIYYFWRENFRQQDHIHQLTLEAQQWKEQNSKLIHGLSDSINQQMMQWGLTVAEKEVALLILKGLSFKEIAEIRSTSEKTTRGQALTIYQKSKLPGRAELSAFFFEDLLSLKNS